MMKNTDYERLVMHARLLHLDLRDCARTLESSAERRALCRAIKKKIDIVTDAVGIAGGAKLEPVLFRTAPELILDARYHAGEAENGLLPIEGVGQRYDLMLDVAQNLRQA